MLLSALGALFAASALAGPLDHMAYRSDFTTFASETCPATSQQSCHNTTVQTNLCCFNAPGGALLQTQFWDTDPVTGPDDSWTIHGLWPDNCDGTYQSNCDSSREYSSITNILTKFGETELLAYMEEYWQSNSGTPETFWEHEWDKHGTCISTLDPDCYTSYQTGQEVVDFASKVVELFKSLPTYTWLSAAGITPSSSKTYTLAAIQAALTKNHGASVYLGCSDSELSEVWYFFNVKGSVQSGTWIPVATLNSADCPTTGIKYLPKNGGGDGGGDGGGGDGGGDGTAFSGSGYLNVVSGGSTKGCLISAGTWYVSGTCATITATASGSGFTLKSSKGSCGIVSGVFTCGSGVTATVFTASGSNLMASGSTAFSADSTPSGTTQGKVYSGSSHSVSLTIEWGSA
ncbi:hypothetical protein PFICI_10240 [Pestalotiopsis fici W106-1]|uniref:Ribonuclease T2-like n=1 Tax=Pestalotiopsis fici (strain W106-1 / CGMCC3.15140) TaxID=1229662 RepID=W3WWC1_PESFW|nr:uncharacterized protein PFICI_10240 [Pestalotiopsis fici W106-1]ETS78178.1 hypothetical protein PFICI_10240 [Pestalotiopsis fici W106-1]